MCDAPLKSWRPHPEALSPDGSLFSPEAAVAAEPLLSVLDGSPLTSCSFSSAFLLYNTDGAACWCAMESQASRAQAAPLFVDHVCKPQTHVWQISHRQNHMDQQPTNPPGHKLFKCTSVTFSPSICFCFVFCFFGVCFFHHVGKINSLAG